MAATGLSRVIPRQRLQRLLSATATTIVKRDRFSGDSEARWRYLPPVSLSLSIPPDSHAGQGHPERISQHGDSLALPFADGEADWVVCYRLPHHFPD